MRLHQGMERVRRNQETKTHLEEAGEEEREELNRVVPAVALVELRHDAGVGVHEARELREELLVELHEHGGVLGGAFGEPRDLREALDGAVAEDGHGEELRDEERDEGRFEDVAQRNPGQEALEGLEGHVEQVRLLALLEDEVAELEDLGELLVQPLLQGLGLGGRHLVLHLEDLLAQQLQDLHVVLAQRLVARRRVDDLRDELGPVLWPFVPQYIDEGQVHFLQEDAVLLHRRLVAAEVDYFLGREKRRGAPQRREMSNQNKGSQGRQRQEGTSVYSL